MCRTECASRYAWCADFACGAHTTRVLARLPTVARTLRTMLDSLVPSSFRLKPKPPKPPPRVDLSAKVSPALKARLEKMVLEMKRTDPGMTLSELVGQLLEHALVDEGG